MIDRELGWYKTQLEKEIKGGSEIIQVDFKEGEDDYMCKRGEVWYAKLPIVKGSRVQGGFRPVLIVGNELQSKKSPTIRIVPLTTEFKRMDLPFHIILESECLLEPSIALVEQEHLIDRNCLREKWGNLSEEDMNNIDVCRFFQSGFKMSIFNTINATNGKQRVLI